MIFLCSILTLNIFTYAIVRFAHGGTLVVSEKPPNPTDQSADHIDLPKRTPGSHFYIICNFLNQPQNAFKYIAPPRAIYLRYSLLGYNPKNAGFQLSGLMYDKDIAIGMSIGAKAIAYAPTRHENTIFVNPCTHKSALKPSLRPVITILALIAKLASYALGWLSIIPIIPTHAENERYSLTLLADQLFWMAYGNPPVIKAKVILSKDDEFLDNDAITKLYDLDKTNSICIKTLHAHTDDETCAVAYAKAVNHLLNL